MQACSKIGFSNLILLVSLSACTTSTVVDTPTSKQNPSLPLVGQKAIQGQPPAHALPIGFQAGQFSSFGYDFNRDGVADWVLVQTGQGLESLDTLIIKLSQSDGSFKTISTNQFDPDLEAQTYNFDWKVRAKLTDSGELYIQNNNTSPMSNSDAMSSYRFKFIGNNFLLRTYAHGYTGHAFGRYRQSFIYDLVKSTLQESKTERCDDHLDQPCASAKTYRLKSGIPTITLEDFNEKRDIKAIMSRQTKIEVK